VSLVVEVVTLIAVSVGEDFCTKAVSHVSKPFSLPFFSLDVYVFTIARADSILPATSVSAGFFDHPSRSVVFSVFERAFIEISLSVNHDSLAMWAFCLVINLSMIYRSTLVGKMEVLACPGDSVLRLVGERILRPLLPLIVDLPVLNPE
jgi:hypothetical protein